MSEFQVGDEVIVTAKGKVKSIEKMHDGRIKYEILDEENWTHCFVFESNILKEEDSELTYRSIAKG